MWHTYVVKCSDGSLYTGITTDIKRRLKEHNSKTGCAYTRTRTPVKLVHKELFKTRSKAAKREAKIKSWDRKEKMNFIERL